MSRRGASRRRRDAQAAAWDETHGVDQSETIHEFPDGWTIRNIVCWQDAQRDGYLIDHCLSWRIGRPTLLKQLARDGTHLLSLRDPTNFPRASFFHNSAHNPACYSAQGLGGLTKEYLQRIREFEQADVPPLTATDRLLAEMESETGPEAEFFAQVDAVFGEGQRRLLEQSRR